MQWSDLNWNRLQSLREGFLRPVAGDYWQDRDLLESYDLTFGKRIGWKWEAVLEELRRRDWQPSPHWRVLDWGCGSGVAARSFLHHFPKHTGIELQDRSKLAVDFARTQALKEHPQVVWNTKGPYILLLSHVINEQTKASWPELHGLIERAEAVVWVEPGTPTHSQQLIEMRETYRDRFQVVAPCPHQERCGLLTENTRAWCHNFAPAPDAVFHDPQWSEFSTRLGIDLRALPVSFLVLHKAQSPPPQKAARLIGRPKRSKGSLKAVVCESSGVRTLQMPTRQARSQGLLKKVPFYKPLIS